MLEFRRLRALVFVSLLVPVIGASCSAPTEERCPDGSRAVGCAPTVDASHDGGTPRDATGDGAFHDGETDQGGSNDDVSRHDASRSDAEPGCVAPSRRMCGGACVACPEGPEVLTTKCAADRCAAASCQPEWRLCGDACCADPTEGVLESAGTTGVFPDLEFDAVGNPHISYFDGTAGQLKHGFWNGTAWRFEVIGPASVEESTDLELDARGNAYVAWYDPDARALRLASRVDGAPWSTETVTNLDDASSPGGPYNALALDAAGHPHIAYHVRVDQTLRYARWDGAAWQQELIADTVMADRSNVDGPPGHAWPSSTSGVMPPAPATDAMACSSAARVASGRLSSATATPARRPSTVVSYWARRNCMQTCWDSHPRTSPNAWPVQSSVRSAPRGVKVRPSTTTVVGCGVVVEVELSAASPGDSEMISATTSSTATTTPPT